MPGKAAQGMEVLMVEHQAPVWAMCLQAREPSQVGIHFACPWGLRLRTGKQRS